MFAHRYRHGLKDAVLRAILVPVCALCVGVGEGTSELQEGQQAVTCVRVCLCLRARVCVCVCDLIHQIDQLKSEMEEATQIADAVRKDMRLLQSRTAVVRVTEPCARCGAALADSPPLAAIGDLPTGAHTHTRTHTHTHTHTDARHTHTHTHTDARHTHVTETRAYRY